MIKNPPFNPNSGSSTAVNITGGTVTASTPTVNATQTWNNGAVAFTGWKLNITDTASAAGSKFQDYQIGGTTVLAIWKNGVIGNIDEGTGFRVTGTTLIGLTGGNEAYRIQAGRITGVSYTVIGFSNSATSADGGNVDIGFARKAAGVVEVNNGTAGVYTGTAYGAGSQTFAQLPSAVTAGAGARSFITDATATTFLSVAAGGGANAVPVVSNGANWLIG